MSRGRKRLAFVGGTEKGKSTQVRKMILHRFEKTAEPTIILDPNRQTIWSDIAAIDFEQMKRMKSGMYKINTMDYEMFFDILFNHKYIRQAVSEDASNWATPQKNMKIYPNLIALRHPDHDIDLTKIFHAVAGTPRYIIEQLNEMMLFKTNDAWENIDNRFPDHLKDEIKRAFDRVNSHPNTFYFERIVLQKTGTK